jgi:hypothetical protein
VLAAVLAGDIVVCSSPIDPHSTIVSRLRAVPGQHIQMQQQPGSKPAHMQVGVSVAAGFPTTSALLMNSSFA